MNTSYERFGVLMKVLKPVLGDILQTSLEAPFGILTTSLLNGIKICLGRFQFQIVPLGFGASKDWKYSKFICIDIYGPAW